jgi:hypothetical protein
VTQSPVAPAETALALAKLEQDARRLAKEIEAFPKGARGQTLKMIQAELTKILAAIEATKL